MRCKAKSGKKPVTFVRIIKLPIKAISKALDLYESCMINFSVNYHTPLMIMEAAPNSQQLPMRRTIISETETDHHRGPIIGGISPANVVTATVTVTDTQVMSNSSFATTSMLWPSPRMRTIHEDRTCSFRDDYVVCKKKLTNKIWFIVKSVCR
ncbi:hypothetical protein R6Q59_035367 [Mikania micrantha]